MSQYIPSLPEAKKMEAVRTIPVEDLARFAKAHEGFVGAVAIRLRELRAETLKRTDHVRDELRNMKTNDMRHTVRIAAFIELCDLIISTQERIYDEDDTCPNVMRPKVWIPLEGRLLTEIFKDLKYLEESLHTFYVRSEEDMLAETNTLAFMMRDLRDLYHTLHEEYYKSTFAVDPFADIRI